MIPEHKRMVVQLDEAGDLADAWRGPFTRVPRHLFLPDRIRAARDGAHTEVDRLGDLARWLDLVYADEALAVRRGPAGDAAADGTSDGVVPRPSVTATVLRDLELTPGMRVLEIGTGTGYTAALLCAHTGPERVTTVEADATLLAGAREALRNSGFEPQMVRGDGRNGYRPGAPYDRVVSAAAVLRVPVAWVEQTRPGGLLLTAWGTTLHQGALVRLRVDREGVTAEGRFHGSLGATWKRATHPVPRPAGRGTGRDAGTEHTTDLHPGQLLDDFDAGFVLGLHVPGMTATVRANGADGATTVDLTDPASGSWATWSAGPTPGGPHRVHQHGPRALFSDLEAAYHWWISEGRPGYRRFGLTVRRSAQAVWLDDPSHVIAVTA